MRPWMHEGYVQTIQGGQGGYFGVCPTCGSGDFPDRRTEAEARADVDAHLDAVSEHAPEWTRAFR